MLDSGSSRNFPALQPVMLVNELLMTLFLGIGYLRVPTTFLHNPFGPENGILKMVMTVEVGRIFNQVWVVDISPVATVTDAGDVPGDVVDCTGYELAEFYGFWHDSLLWTQKGRPIEMTDRLGWWANGLFG